MRPSWDPKSPKLLPSIICYADILGFRAMTEDALELGKEEKFLQRIKQSLASAYDEVRRAAILGGWVETPVFDMKVFTDNIVVAYPLRDPTEDRGEPELGTLIDLFAHVQARLAVDGFFLRGAITAGHHYQDQDIAYGEALLEAVDLNKPGGPPRLVTGASVDSLIVEHLAWYGGIGSPHHAFLLEDPYDGRLFIDYLGVSFDHFPDGPIGHQLLAAHRKKVSKRLREHESDGPVRQKYQWIATYHNYVCRTFANQFTIGYAEEVDLDDVAVAEEAQRVLDHLIASEELPTERCPRPLNAQRLQQRIAKTQTPPSV